MRGPNDRRILYYQSNIGASYISKRFVSRRALSQFSSVEIRLESVMLLKLPIMHMLLSSAPKITLYMLGNCNYAQC